MHCLIRAETNGIEDLYIEGMDELLIRDAAFFHDNFAGSLTKRVLSFASRYEDFLDYLCFNILRQCAAAGLRRRRALALRPAARRRAVRHGLLHGRRGAAADPPPPGLVDAREACWARVSGQVADTLSNMDAVRAHAAEPREAHAHRARVAQLKTLTVRSWDYSNLRIDLVTAPMAVLANTLGLLLALRIGGGHLGVEAIVVTFAYFCRRPGCCSSSIRSTARSRAP